MHFNWKYPKYIKSIEIGNIKYSVPKGILFGMKSKQRFRNSFVRQSSTKNGEGGIVNFIVGFILEMCFIIIGMFKYKSS